MASYKQILGVGGFGKVYLARYHPNSKFYALKAIKKSIAHVEHKALNQVITERDILVSCQSPFVVDLFCTFQDKKFYYFCLEYVSGGNLSFYLKKLRHFSVEETRFYACQILLGMQYLHEEANIIHRDLKPENVLLDEDGQVKLADFGLSKSTLLLSSRDRGNV